jgi:hypothetical protein
VLAFARRIPLEWVCVVVPLHLAALLHKEEKRNWSQTGKTRGFVAKRGGTRRLGKPADAAAGVKRGKAFGWRCV